MAASRFEIAMYCNVFCRVKRLAGIASFQLSPVKTFPTSVVNSDVAGAEGEIFCEISYSATVRQTASLRTSLRNTAVDVKYLCGFEVPSSGIIRE